ncbi:MAG: L,D-transpeptidase family protein [Candidatus Zixiibacteriota bacterium]
MSRGRYWWPVGIAGMLLVGGCEKAPIELSRVTWDALQECRRERAEVDAPMVWEEAKARYDSAWLVITTENRQWFFERHFAPAESLFIRAGQSARQAIRLAREAREAQRLKLGGEIAELAKDLSTQQRGIDQHLARIPLQRELTEAELRVASAQRSFEQESLVQAEAAVLEAREALAVLRERQDKNWVDDRELPRWRHMVDETVAWSRATDSTALVVVKTDRRAYLLRQGRIVTDFPVEFGYRSWQPKLRAGDGATPEGIYRVTQCRDRGSRYYKALVLDYPNEYDRLRFEKNRKVGNIPRGARIGGNIEIHGEGGRGRDWTEGCVALSNPDMDRLMRQMHVGDRVTIVRDVEGWPE